MESTRHPLANKMAISRRQLFRGQIASRQQPIRPPWALAEAQFIEACTRCDECIKACPEQIIAVGSGGYPVLNFQENGCTFCGRCLEVCQEGALVKRENLPPWPYQAVIADDCLSRRGVSCRACGDACDEQAIRFKIESGGVSIPIIDDTLCTGCGFCLRPCPVNVISLRDSNKGEKQCLS